MLEYAALVASPRALPDGLILVFQHPVKSDPTRFPMIGNKTLILLSLLLDAISGLYICWSDKYQAVSTAGFCPDFRIGVELSFCRIDVNSNDFREFEKNLDKPWVGAYFLRSIMSIILKLNSMNPYGKTAKKQNHYRQFAG